MASTYSTSNRIELMATGEKSGTWGDITNGSWALIEDAIDGYVAVAMADANATLTTVNGASDQARNKVIKATGAHTATRDLIIPAVEKVYVVHNATTGGQSVRIKTSGGVAATIAASAKALVYCDATDCYAVATSTPDLGVTGLVAETSAGVYSGRTLTAPAAGITVTNGDGVSGNPTLVLANDLAGLEGLATSGLAARTGTSTWATRTLTQPAAGITVSNGDGVSGNPTLALANMLAALQTLGTAGTVGVIKQTAANTVSAVDAVGSVVLQTFTANGTYTPTSGMLYALLGAVGGGAGGGGCANSGAGTQGSAGGGGGGSTSLAMKTAAQIGASQTVTIGAAANGGGAGNNNGTAGNDTSIGALCIGKGGSAGGGSASGAAGTSGAGGIVGTGDIRVVGQDGGVGTSAGIITARLTASAGGSSGLGFGSGARATVTASDTTGANGGNYGGGGAGGASLGASGAAGGGNGAQGIAFALEFVKI